MLVVFDSKTGNVEKFIKKLPFKSQKISKDLIVDEPFVLVTYTTGYGCAPESVLNFLEKNYPYMQGVAASGNRNWGQLFGGSADKISALYGVPILLKFEVAGFPAEVNKFIAEVTKLKSESAKLA